MDNIDTSWRTTEGDLPDAWSGEFLAVYPDGTQSHYDLSGHVYRPGDRLPDGHVIDHWEVTTKPVRDTGKPMLVGILRRDDEEQPGNE
jgi:hypothetical protein